MKQAVRHSSERDGGGTSLPPPALLYIGGRSRPYKPADVYLVSVAETTCECGRGMGFTGVAEGGKSPDIRKKKRWQFKCYCGNTRWLKRSERIR